MWRRTLTYLSYRIEAGCVSSNEETPFTGRAESFYENGQKKREENYKDERRTGFRLGGTRTGRSTRKETGRTASYGARTEWYENGQKEREGK